MAWRPDDLPEGNLFMTCSFLEVTGTHRGEQKTFWTLKNECEDGRYFANFLTRIEELECDLAVMIPVMTHPEALL